MEVKNTTGIMLILLGILFFIIQMFDLDWSKIWPLILILVGLSFLFGKNK